MTDPTQLWLAAEQALVGAGPAHDIRHVRRVTALARHLCRQLGARQDVVVPAAILHELVNLPKDHPRSSRSGDLCAEAARELLRSLGWSPSHTEEVCACIRDHSWSKGAEPPTIEAAILQDADRLDAIGAIGVARCMATCGEIGRPLYQEDDPFCTEREPDDRRYGLDHVFKKLLRIEERLNTVPARAIAKQRTAFLRQFVDQLAHELDDA